MASEATATHLDRCLGCMACVPACPSGVRYDRLIEAGRSWAEEPPGAPAPAPLPPRSSRERAARAAIFATFPYPARLRMLTRPLRAAQRTGMIRRIEGSKLAARFAPEMVASLRVAPLAAPGAPDGAGPPGARARAAAGGGRPAHRVRAAGVLPWREEATVRVLAAEGCDVVIPRKQGCCGALSLHSGRATEAARFARRAMTAFEDAGVDMVVVNSAGCGSAMKEYTRLFHRPRKGPSASRALHQRRPRPREFLAELAADGGPPADPASAPGHGGLPRGLPPGARPGHPAPAPRTARRRSRAWSLVEPADPGTCCGSAGVYNLLQPEAAGELGARKAASVLATGAPLVISANPGCSLQISAAITAAGSQRPPAMAHIAEVLDASLRGAPVSELTGRSGTGDPVPGPPAPRLAGAQPVRVEFPLGHDHRGPGQPAGSGLQRHQQLTPRHRDVPLAGGGFSLRRRRRLLLPQPRPRRYHRSASRRSPARAPAC